MEKNCTDLVRLRVVLACSPPTTPSKAVPARFSWNRRWALEASAERCPAGGKQQDAQVAEWLKAADCKSATLRVTKVRILPCAPLLSLWLDCEGSSMRCWSGCGSKPCRQRTHEDRARRDCASGDRVLADDGAGKVPFPYLGAVGAFCLPHHPRAAAFAVGLEGLVANAGVAQWQSTPLVRERSRVQSSPPAPDFVPSGPSRPRLGGGPHVKRESVELWLHRRESYRTGSCG
jgi:hypothetical protein